MTKARSQRKKTGSARAAEQAAAETPENLDKVRDILFGGQMRAVDQRLAVLEERFHRDLSAQRSELDKGMSTLETYLKKEIGSLSDKLGAERSKRADDLKTVASELKEALRGLDKRLAKLDDSSSKADADLRTAILEHTKSVTSQLKELTDSFSGQLQQAVSELRSEKLDTATLVQLFSDMALHLSEDLQSEPAQD